MKTDMYTKIILTVIAIVLTVNLFKSNISPARADTKNYVSVPVNSDGTINVRIKQQQQDELDVKIEDVSSNAFYLAEPLQVKIKE